MSEPRSCPECTAPVKEAGTHLNLEPKITFDESRVLWNFISRLSKPDGEANGYVAWSRQRLREEAGLE